MVTVSNDSDYKTTVTGVTVAHFSHRFPSQDAALSRLLKACSQDDATTPPPYVH